jgi:Ca2+/Na+ antiporter
MFMLIVNIGMTIAYVMIKTKLKSLKRVFQTSFGVFGAASVLIFFFFCLVKLLLVDFDINQFLVFILTMVLFTAVYFFVARHKQSFSDEEKEVLFKAHIERREFQLLRYFVVCVNFLLFFFVGKYNTNVIPSRLVSLVNPEQNAPRVRRTRVFPIDKFRQMIQSEPKQSSMDVIEGSKLSASISNVVNLKSSASDFFSRIQWKSESQWSQSELENSQQFNSRRSTDRDPPGSVGREGSNIFGSNASQAHRMSSTISSRSSKFSSTRSYKSSKFSFVSGRSLNVSGRSVNSSGRSRSFMANTGYDSCEQTPAGRTGTLGGLDSSAHFKSVREKLMECVEDVEEGGGLFPVDEYAEADCDKFE